MAQTTSKTALDAILRTPPAVIEEAVNDPDLFARLSRAQLFAVQDKLVRSFLNDPNASLSQGVQVHDTIRKVSGLDKQDNLVSSTGFTVQIVFGANPQAKLVDVTPPPAALPENGS